MTVNYTSLLGLALPVTGTEAGAWGDVVNNYLTSYLDASVAGTQTITGSQTAVTLAVTNGATLVTVGSGATGSAQFQIITCTGNPASLLTITAPASSRQYIIINSTSTSQSVKIVGAGPTTGVTIVSGEKAHVAWNGSDFVKIATQNGNGDFVTVDTTNLEVTNIKAKDGTASMTLADSTGVVTFSKATVIEATDNTNAALRITQLGTGNALLVEDSANPDTTPFVVTATGDVGIGTSSPATKLHVSSSGSTEIRVSNTGISLNAAFAAGSAGVDFGTSTNHPIDFYTNSSLRMKLDTSGNLGLGATPSAWGAGIKALQIGTGASLINAGVSGDAYLGQNVFFNGTNNLYINTQSAGQYAIASGVHTWYNAPSGTANSAVVAASKSYTVVALGTTTLAQWQASFNDASNNPLTVTPTLGQVLTSLSSPVSPIPNGGLVTQNISFTQAMTLLANGNLGIGETNPAVRLDVLGQGRVIYNTGATNTGDQSVVTVGATTSGAYSSTYGAGLQFQVTNSGGGYAGSRIVSRLGADNNTANLVFQARNYGYTDSMTLDASGNLGIGTNNPAYKLDVNTGQIRAQESGTGSGDGSLIGATVSANGNAGVLFQTNSVSRWNLTTQGTAGANLRIYNYTLGATVATFDPSGNLGLGVTPDNWSAIVAFQVGNGASLHGFGVDEATLSANTYYNGGYKYAASSFATQYQQQTGKHQWFIAPSGTANSTTIVSGNEYTIVTAGGNFTTFGAANNNVGTVFTATSSGTASGGAATQSIVFTQAMTLDASGNLVVGATSPLYSTANRGNITINGASTAILGLGIAGVAAGYLYTDANTVQIGAPSSKYISFDINGERARISSDGTFRVKGAGTAGTTDAVQFSGSAPASTLILDSSGNLVVGDTSAGSKFDVLGGNSSGSDWGNINITSRNVINATNRIYTALRIRDSGSSDAGAIGYSYNGTGYNMMFATVPSVGGAITERARITSGGNFLVGTDNSAENAGSGMKVLNTGGTVALVSAASDSSQQGFEMYSTTAAAYRLYINYAGTINATSTTISAISDQRLKENIQDLDVGLDKIMALKPRKFDWKTGKGKDIKGDRGWIAQEFEQVFPDLIDEWRDPAPEGEEPYKSVRADLIPVLVKAIQEQQAMINELKAEVAALKGA